MTLDMNEIKVHTEKEKNKTNIVDEDLVFVIDMKGRILSINKAFSTQFGYNEEELTGLFLTHICLHELNKEVLKNLKSLFDGSSPMCLLPLMAKTGQLIPFEISVNKDEWCGQKAYYCLGQNISVSPLSLDLDSQIFNSVATPLVLYSRLYNIFIDVNQEFEHTFGYTRIDIVGRHPGDFDFFQNSEKLEEAINLFEVKNSLKEFETVLKDRSGNELIYSISAGYINIHSTEYLLISATDISKVKETEFRLNHQLNQQKLIADISQELNRVSFYSKLDKILTMLGEHTGVSRVYIFEDSEKGLITNNTFEWCNTGINPQISNLQGIPYEIIPSWRKLLIDEGRVFSQNILELPDDLRAVLEPQGIKSILIFPIYAEDIFIGFIGFDECTINKEWREDELDLLKLISNILSNAFERRIMLGKITEKQIRLELAVGNAREGIWDWNIKTNELFFDDTWAEMLGYATNELKPDFSTWENLLHPDDKIQALLHLHNHLTGKTEHFESTFRMCTKSGKWKWILNKGKIISYDDDKNPIRAIGKHTDLTEIKRTEEKLKAGLEKEKELNELKSRFISNASHEFRTPLASVLLICDVLKQYWKQLDHEQIEQRIDKIINQGTHLTGIVNKVFEISKFQEGKTSLSPVEVDLVDMLKTIVKGFNLQIEFENRITFFTPVNSLPVVLDQKLIIQAVNNLISNALRYSASDALVQVKLMINGKEIQVQVIDSGIGIPREDQKHLFQPFFRAANTGNIPGNGLGLNIAKESVLLHGGKIKFCSKPGNRTTFIICLPKKYNTK